MQDDLLMAGIDDLDRELGRHGDDPDGRLRKIVCFCNTTLALHQGLDVSARDAVDAKLREVARRHGLADACVHGASAPV